MSLLRRQKFKESDYVNSKLYYILQHTCVIIGTVIVYVCGLVFLPFAKGTYKTGNAFTIELKQKINLGFSIGPVIVVGNGYTSILSHEYGHTIQNMILGPFAIILVYIPSVLRFWVREKQFKEGYSLPPYDSVWFEGTATKLGSKYLFKEIKEDE